QLSGALAESGFVSKSAADQYAGLRAQQREVSEYRVQADPRGVDVAADAVRKFYDANPARFQVPEEVQVEYVALSADAIAASEQVAGEEIAKVYEANQSRYGEPEQRRASHILITVKAGGAGEGEKRKARERAAALVAKLRAAPGSFEEIAKKESGDPGSASK